MKPLIVIPARGGSKGVPKKNIKLLNGKPLIQYTIEAARELFKDEFICVSTDDLEIKNVVESLGLEVPFIRPETLSHDTAGTYEVLLHAIDFFEKEKKYFPDTVILLQPTSPFRNSTHISNALSLYSEDTEMVVSVKETTSNPYFVLMEEDENGWLKKSKEGKFIRRQDCPKVYELNGAIYIMNIRDLKFKSYSLFTKIIKFQMEELESLDIDTMIDWKLAEILIAQNYSE